MDNKIISSSELDSYIKKIKHSNKSIILVGGCFDILHKGHIEFLHKAGLLADKLLVFLESDGNVKRRKGLFRPIHTQEDRARIIEKIKGVDAVILLPDITEDNDYFELVKRCRPDIIGITAGEENVEIFNQHADAVGARLVEVMPRIKGYSTQEIINKVKRS